MVNFLFRIFLLRFYIFIKKNLKKIICLFFLLNNIKVFSFSEKIDEIIAIVNEDVILKSDFNKNLKKHELYLEKEKKSSFNKVRIFSKLLEKLIDKKIILQIAKREKIKISAKEIKDEIFKIARFNNLTVSEFEKQLKINKIKLIEYKNDIFENKILEKVYIHKVFPRIKILREELESFLELIKSKINENTDINLDHIFIPLSNNLSEKRFNLIVSSVAKIYQNFKSGKDFNFFLNNFSNFFYLENQKIGWVKLKNLSPIFLKRLQYVKNSEILDPILSDLGIHILKVNKVNSNLKEAKFSHILVKFSKNKKLTYNKIKYIYKKIKNREISFFEATKKFSEDFLIILNNGNFEWNFLNKYGYLFQNIFQNLKEKEISKPFCSDFGCHLIKVEKIIKLKNKYNINQAEVFKIIFERKFNEEKEKWIAEERNFSYIKIFDKKYLSINK